MILSMSLNGSSECPEGSARGFKRRRVVFDLDLNYPPPEENTALTDPRGAQPRENVHSQRETLVNAEFIDEEIVVISPRKFAKVCIIVFMLSIISCELTFFSTEFL